MDTTVNDVMFAAGFFVCLTVIFIIWLIYKYYKWVEKVKDKLRDIESKQFFQEEKIDNLKARVKRLEDRINNISYNEEGIGSINPSEADTE